MRTVLIFYILLLSGQPVPTGEAYLFPTMGDCEAVRLHPAVLGSRPGQIAVCVREGE